MSSSSHWWIGWAIWSGIILVLGLAGFLWLRNRLRRIRRTMRGEEVPPDLEWRDDTMPP